MRWTYSPAVIEGALPQWRSQLLSRETRLEGELDGNARAVKGSRATRESVGMEYESGIMAKIE